MSKFEGRLYLLKVRVGGTYVTVAAQRSTSFSIGVDLIDTTTKDGSRWRELLEGGVQHIAIDSSGLVSDAQSFELLQQFAADGTINDFLLAFANSQELRAPLQVASFEASGDYQDAQQYSISLESANDAEIVIPPTPGASVSFIPGVDAGVCGTLQLEAQTNDPIGGQVKLEVLGVTGTFSVDWHVEEYAGLVMAPDLSGTLTWNDPGDGEFFGGTSSAVVGAWSLGLDCKKFKVVLENPVNCSIVGPTEMYVSRSP